MKRIVFLLLLLSVCGAYANNIRVTDATRLAAPNRDMVAFTLSWDNSWRVGGAPGNHDAAWLFVKLRPCDGGPWQHGLLSTTMGNHIIGGDLEAVTPISLADRFGVTAGGATESNHLGHNTGIMLRRSSFGKGHIVSVRCTLKLVNTVAEFDPAIEYSIRVIGIEMVQVRSGSFVVGDGVSAGRFNTVTIDAANYNQILPAATLGGSWGSYHSFHQSGTTVDLPAAYPKGYEEFYCMKYEISQGMFADFMNSVDGYAGSPAQFFGRNRNNLTINAGATSSTPNRAQNFMNWDDLLSYLDWAALRPMTELEYEKACRGPIMTPGEFAWGTTSHQYGFLYDGAPDGTETCLTRNANCHYAYVPVNGPNSSNTFYVNNAAGGYFFGQITNYGTNGTNSTRNSWTTSPADSSTTTPPNTGVTTTGTLLAPVFGVNVIRNNTFQGYGPVGCGVFARDATQSRLATGASYWGIMELSGNVMEQCVGVQAASVVYTGRWGDGYLGAGVANVTGWDRTVRASRGGSYGGGPGEMRVSDRRYMRMNSTVRDQAHTTENGWGWVEWDVAGNGFDVSPGGVPSAFKDGYTGGRGVR